MFNIDSGYWNTEQPIQSQIEGAVIKILMQDRNYPIIKQATKS